MLPMDWELKKNINLDYPIPATVYHRETDLHNTAHVHLSQALTDCTSATHTNTHTHQHTHTNTHTPTTHKDSLKHVHPHMPTNTYLHTLLYLAVWWWCGHLHAPSVVTFNEPLDLPFRLTWLLLPRGVEIPNTDYIVCTLEMGRRQCQILCGALA